MSNPARQLHEIYARWRSVANSKSTGLRGIVNPNTNEGARELAAAASCLIRIDQIIDEFEANGRSVAVYRRQYPEWWKGVIGYQKGWSASLGADEILIPTHMDQIESFANYLDGKVWDVDARKDDLRSILVQARTALENDDELSAPLRSFLHRLLAEIQRALDDDAIGETFDFSDALHRLFVAFKAAEGEATKESGVWRTLWTQFVPALAAGGILEGGALVLQLTSGG